VAEAKRMIRRRPTETSSFGVSGRQSHDSSAYYTRALLQLHATRDCAVVRAPDEVVNRFYNGTSEKMSELPDACVALMVTSPEYHVGKEYENPEQTVGEYLDLLRSVLAETYRVLEDGGRAVVNVANLGRKPYVQLADLVSQVAVDVGFLPRGEIIWVKADGAGGNMAVGSWLSPSAPCLRDLHEYCLVFSKSRWERAIAWKARKARGLPWEADITQEEFLRDTLSIWRIQSESAKRIGHPAPFPVELPRRLVKLFTYRDDLVLDPFVGAGATAVAAASTGRRFVGYDIEEKYLEIAERRVAEALGNGSV
jgi:DNA modification methylase